MSGRRPIEIDLAEVERLAGLGLTQQEIADALGISAKTIERRKQDSVDFVAAIKRGQAQAAGKVANALFTEALNGNITAIIWYEKTRRGLSDKMDISWRDEATRNGIDPDALKQQVAAILRRSLAAGDGGADS